MRLQQRYPGSAVTVVEAEGRVSEHQSGHNSGVLHSGIYYQPGSQKALLCRAGKRQMEQFCTEHGIPWERCGKVVVATTPEQIPRLDKIAERGAANGVEFHRISVTQLRELEPAVAGVAALHVPETGIVNYRRVCEVLAELIGEQRGEVKLHFRVQAIRERGQALELTSAQGTQIACGQLINCAGLHSDRVCRLAGGAPEVQIVPFRGEYYELRSSSESLCRNLIYPVPDPSFPFLGVHFTRMIDGGVECGPNAVLALAREGYRWTDVRLGDLSETLAYRGFQKLARRYWRTGAGEIHRSLRKSAFVRALQQLIPSIRGADLKPGRAGVRAQAVAPDGTLVDDFLIQKNDRAIHVLNAPSPAATASLAIAEQIVNQVG